MRIIQLIFLTGIVSFSCTHGVDTRPIEARKLLAVSSIISTLDAVLTAEVYQGQPLGKLIGDSLAVVPDAVVRISSEGREVVLTYEPSNRRYEAVNPFREAEDGAVFHLEVVSTSGDRVTAQSRLPPKPQVPVIDGEMIGEVHDPSLRSFKFLSYWENPGGYPYCTAWANSSGIETNDGQVFSLEITLNPIQGAERYPTDRQVAGTNIADGAVWGASIASKPFELSVTIANIEESIFRYYQSYWSYNDWEINTGNLFPSFREPAPIYSNINGGAGLFASINCRIGTVQIDPER